MVRVWDRETMTMRDVAAIVRDRVENVEYPADVQPDILLRLVAELLDVLVESSTLDADNLYEILRQTTR